MTWDDWFLTIVAGGALGCLWVAARKIEELVENTDKIAREAAQDRYRMISALEQIERNTSPPYVDDEEPLG